MEKCFFFRNLSFISPICEIWPWKFFSFWLGPKDDMRKKNFTFLGIFGENIGKIKSNFLDFYEKMEKWVFFRWCKMCKNEQNRDFFNFFKKWFPRLLVHKNDWYEVFGLFLSHFLGRKAIHLYIRSTCGGILQSPKRKNC